MRTFIILAATLIVSSTAEAQRLTRAAIAEPTASPVASITVTTTPLLRHLSRDCELDRTRGREAADQLHSGSGWMAGGFVSGILLGLIGTGISWAMASSSTVENNRVPDGVEASCYRDGYTSKAKSKNGTNALTGGLLGTAVLVVLVVSATRGSTY
jgi:hypothetical protein